MIINTNNLCKKHRLGGLQNELSLLIQMDCITSKLGCYVIKKIKCFIIFHQSTENIIFEATKLLAVIYYL